MGQAGERAVAAKQAMRTEAEGTVAGTVRAALAAEAVEEREMEVAESAADAFDAAGGAVGFLGPFAPLTFDFEDGMVFLFKVGMCLSFGLFAMLVFLFTRLSK